MVAGLIEEIQREALNNNVAIESLLRRVKLAAAKLNLQSLETWVESELSGYFEDVPEYRKLLGQIYAWNPFRGWVPIQFDSDRMISQFNIAHVNQPISGLRDAVESEPIHSVFEYPLPIQIVAHFNKYMNFQTSQIMIQVPRGAVVGIIDTVRNKVLDWAIEMERQGVKGEGLSFSATEKQEAKIGMANISFNNVGSVIGNIGVGNSSTDITVSEIDARQFTALTKKIKEALPELEKNGADIERLSTALAAIEAEISNTVPSNSKLSGYLVDARSAVVGAVGNLTADGVIAGIAGLLKLLGY